ncbi:hypothetical protein H0484_01275 [Pusillimonas sp. CC-YST705]|uniref:Lysozyme inhibitor LprI-like N-terminal domain-containing protein n=1 Tax=Mesopusillimonas faecipullorum TaxID=2755040 RepID=A0ABS8C967_9BURK|nr:lysozyme inhibitor LprI family protein [Mesopusillimonas faecipullorum]MCB5362387.1 hypothetical protein [Mesopusillimonas faecipullorum]
MKIALLTIAAALLFPTTVFAKDRGSDPQDQATMNECAGASLKQSHKKLNDLFKHIEIRLTDDAAWRIAAQGCDASLGVRKVA